MYKKQQIWLSIPHFLWEKQKTTSLINIVSSPLALILCGGRNYKWKNKPLKKS